MAETLPSYETTANALEKDKGSGVRLAGWTVARTMMIGPAMMAVGIDAKRAFGGAALSSGLISLFTLAKVVDTRARKPNLPTYKTAAEVLNRDDGAALRMLGWTVARTIMIGPPMMAVGVPAKHAFAGAALASSLISVFTLMRIFDARATGLAGVKGYRPQPRRPRRPHRRHAR